MPQPRAVEDPGPAMTKKGGLGGLHPHYLVPCVNCQPKRPLMQRFPCVTEWSSGELTFTIRPSWACTVSSQPTPQYGQIVSVRVCFDSPQVPAARMSYSIFPINAPVGQTPMQFPQYTHADSVSGISNSVAMCAWNPRPATPDRKSVV